MFEISKDDIMAAEHPIQKRKCNPMEVSMKITFDIPETTNSISFTLVMIENNAISTFTDCFNAQIIGEDVVVTGNIDEGYKRFPRTKSDWDQINRSESPNS